MLKKRRFEKNRKSPDLKTWIDTFRLIGIKYMKRKSVLGLQQHFNIKKQGGRGYFLTFSKQKLIYVTPKRIFVHVSQLLSSGRSCLIRL